MIDMSAEEISEYELDDLVYEVLDDEPTEYRELMKEVEALNGSPVSPTEIESILEEEKYVAVLGRSEDGDLIRGYRLDE
jgi:DNA-binding PadR family transcriptional regulator